MRFFLFFLLETALVLAITNDPVLVCRKDKSDSCTCVVVQETKTDKSLEIECVDYYGLNTTNIVVPDLLLKDISSVQITFINTSISQIISPVMSEQLKNLVVKLEITKNKIGRIEKNVFDKLPNLKKLNLPETQLDDTLLNSGWMTPMLGKTLRYLILSKNNIKQITKGLFGNLVSLEVLDLSKNSIQSISIGSFDGLNSLSTIFLLNNDIRKIDDSAFDNLKSLETLNLDNNPKLSLGQKTFGPNGLINLNWLILSKCNLQSISDGFLKNLQNLTLLNLMGNQLTSVPTTIRTTKLLRELYLSSNNITQINSNAFGNHQFLTELYLNNLDQLSVISDCAFCGLTGLNQIFLSYNNNLKQIHENAFGFSKNSVDKTHLIKEIDIHDGGLKTVPVKLMPWSQIRTSILGNPANCDPKMDWLFRSEKYDVDLNPTGRYYNDPAWCEQCKHDRVCQDVYGWTDPPSF